MTPAPDPKQVEDFLANKASYPDAEEVHAWLEGHPEELDKVILTEDLRDSELMSVPGIIKKRVLDRVLGRTASKMVHLKRWAAAAVVTGLLLVSVLLIRTRQQEPETNVVTTTTIRNNTGNLMDYRLPDGSQLSLRPGASIVFAGDFPLNRLVTVAGGDVYFRVKKDGGHPFRVITNGISTTAVGTEFWVQQFTTRRLNVALETGKVFIHAVDKDFKMDTVFLLPGQNCTIDKATGLVSVWTSGQKNRVVDATPAGKQNAPATNAIVWTNSEIQFSNAALANVFAKLEHRYNIKIIASDTSVYQATLTGKIFYNDSLDVLIAAICKLNQLSYEKSKDTIFLKRK